MTRKERRRPRDPGAAVALSYFSAEGGTRTPTSFRPLAPEASASTSSTTSARGRNVIGARGSRQTSKFALRYGPTSREGGPKDSGSLAHQATAPEARFTHTLSRPVYSRRA